MQDLFVGVDAGGSHTVAALARGDRLLRTIVGDAANPSLGGVDAASAAIVRSIEAVLDGESAAAIGIGVAGAGSEAIQKRLRATMIRCFPAARIAVSDDAHIALRAAVPEEDGIVVIAGTGSIAYGEVGDRRYYAGGFGYLLGDEGSGYAIGAAALRDLIAAGDRALLARIYQSPRPVAEIAAYARIVLRRAAAGDERAAAIVDHAANSLVQLIRTVVTRSGKQGLPLAFSGGLLRERNALSDLLEQRIAELPLDVRVVERRQDSYLGALSEARRLVAPL